MLKTTPTKPGDPQQLGLTLTLILLDKDGNKLKEITWPGRSHLIQFWEIIYAAYRKNDRPNVTDIAGAAQTVQDPGAGAFSFLDAGWGSSSHDFGPVVGAGTDAVTTTDNALQLRITDGAGAGQLVYGFPNIGEPAAGADGCSLSVSRTFTNNSGGLVTIREIGLYVHCNTPAGPRYFCIIRDLTDDDFEVADLQECCLIITQTTPL